MLLSRLIANAPTEIEKMLLEQQETIKKLNDIQNEVDKIKNHPSNEIIKNMYDASNTPTKPIFDMSNNPLMVKAEKFFDTIDNITNYIAHPVLIVNAIASASYWICGIIAIGGILYYIIGHKKGLKYTTGSLLAYTLIKIVNYGLNSL